MVALPELESPTVVAVREARAARQRNFPSIGIPASQLAEPCDARIWYAFRWAHPPEKADGQKLRRFETGYREEDRIVADLAATPGVHVDARDPATGKQYAIRLLGGHVRGKLDGKVTGLLEAPKTTHVLEAKAMGKSGFNEVKKKGVAVAKPLHYGQAQLYMAALHLTRALYYVVCTDDDREHAERVEADPGAAIALLAKAENIVGSDRRPPRIAEDLASKLAWPCGQCPAKGVCHLGDFAQRNCRTCLHASPLLSGDARWWCERRKRDLTREDQEAGCAHHRFLPSLVPGEQVDADEAAETVTYRMADGRQWTDGPATQEIAHAQG